jgi:hypothetical protein
MVQKGAGRHHPFNVTRNATQTAPIQLGRMTGNSPDWKTTPDIFGRRRFLEVAAGALAMTQLATGQVANARLVLDRRFKLAQSERSGKTNT